MACRNFYACNICQTSFNERSCHPIALKCEHSLCWNCAEEFCCPHKKCRKTITEEDYNKSLPKRKKSVELQDPTGINFPSEASSSAQTEKTEEPTRSSTCSVCTFDFEIIIGSPLRSILLNCGHKICKLCVKKYCPLGCKIVAEDDEWCGLQKIYRSVKGRKSFGWSDHVFDRSLFGKITASENMLFFHSLHEYEAGSDTTYVKFSEIEQDLLSRKLHTFIEFISQNEEAILVIIEMKKNRWTSHFINSFTGQCGPSFKSHKLRQSRITVGGGPNLVNMLQVINDDWIEPPTSQLIRYALGDRTIGVSDLYQDDFGECPEDTIFVSAESFNAGASFNLIHSKNGQLSTDGISKCVGKVIYSSNPEMLRNLIDKKARDIKDCGIAISM